MSTKSVGGQDKEFPAEHILAGGKSRLEITVAIKNKKTGKWETPILKPEEKHSLQGAIETLRRDGQLKKKGEWSAFEKEGSILEVTQEGIFVRENDPKPVRDWKSLLTDTDSTVSVEVKQQVKKTLASVKSIIENSSKTRKKNTPLETEEKNVFNLNALAGKGDIVIEVRVLSVGANFEQYANSEQENYNSLLQVNNRLQDPSNGTAFLQYKIFSNPLETGRIAEMQSRMQALTDASQEISTAMIKVNELLKENKTEQAIKYYIDNIPLLYSVYCDALREWQNEQQVLDEKFNLLQEKNPFHIDLKHIDFQISVAKELLFHASNAFPNIQTQAALDTIAVSKLNFTNFVKLAEISKKKINELIQKEKKFNNSIQQELSYFNNSEFINEMKEQGWSEEDIEKYITNLQNLKDKSANCLLILNTTSEHLGRGEIQKGMNHFSKEMENFHSDFTDACKELIVQQKLASGRTLGEKKDAFSLNLDHTSSHLVFLEDVSKLVNETNALDGKSTKIVDEAEWNIVLQKMTKTAEVLKKENTFSKIAGQINYYQTRSLDFTKQLGSFVEEYKHNRERFEFIMRKHGISDLESALIFNHYTEAYQALQDWDRGFQKIVDLVNQKKYIEAIEAYASLINNNYPQLVAKIKSANFAIHKLKNPLTAEAFHEFAELQEIKNAQQLFVTLSTERLAIKQRLDFEEFLKLSVKEELLEGIVKKDPKSQEETYVVSDDKLPETVARAKKLIFSEIDKLNEDVGEFEYLFSQDTRFLNFFNYGNLNNDPVLKKEWKAILHKYKWLSKDIEEFAKLDNDYAQLIQPLKEGEQAIAAESNLQKKRALKAQYKVMAKQIMPEVQKLHIKLKKLGGFDKLKTLEKAAQEISAKKNGATEKLKSELNVLYVKGQNFWDPFFPNFEAFVNGLENYVETQSPDMRNHLATFVFPEELKLVRQIKFNEKIMSEANFLAERMKEKVSYCDTAFTEIGLLGTWDAGSIERLLLEGSNGQDEAFLQLLQDHNWNKAGINILSRWCDKYIAEFTILFDAKKALDADPESPILQTEFKRVAKQQIPKLNRLRNEFSEKIGRKKVENLQWTVGLYLNRLLKESERINNNILNNQGLRPEEKTLFQRQIDNMQVTIRKLMRADQLLNNIFTADTAIRTIDKAASFEMSWDNNFLKPLLDEKSPLFQIKSGGEFYWKKLLSEKNLDKVTIGSIIKLHQNYQKTLNKIVDLERKLELHPENRRLRIDLMKEMKKQKSKLDKLDRQFLTKETEIEQLKSAILSTQDFLKNSLNVIKDLETQAFQATSEADREALIKTINKNRESIGGFSNDEMQSMLNLLDHLDIEKAFSAKKAENQQVFTRFGKYLA